MTPGAARSCRWTRCARPGPPTGRPRRPPRAASGGRRRPPSRRHARCRCSSPWRMPRPLSGLDSRISTTQPPRAATSSTADRHGASRRPVGRCGDDLVAAGAVRLHHVVGLAGRVGEDVEAVGGVAEVGPLQADGVLPRWWPDRGGWGGGRGCRRRGGGGGRSRRRGRAATVEEGWLGCRRARGGEQHRRVARTATNCRLMTPSRHRGCRGLACRPPRWGVGRPGASGARVRRWR